MENECAGNENKIILEDFNIIMDKMDKGGRCCAKGPGPTII